MRFADKNIQIGRTVAKLYTILYYNILYFKCD